MMTTARSDVATGRYNDTAPENIEITETRILEMREMAESLEDDERRRRSSSSTGNTARTGKTPRRTTSSTAAGLRAGLLRRGVQLRQGGRSSATGRTPRTARTGVQQQQQQQQVLRQPGERPAHGG